MENRGGVGGRIIGNVAFPIHTYKWNRNFRRAKRAKVFNDYLFSKQINENFKMNVI